MTYIVKKRNRSVGLTTLQAAGYWNK